MASVSVTGKRKRSAYTVAQKQELIQYQDKHPKASQQAIADHFTTVWGCNVGRRTVGDILQQRDKWLAVDVIAEPAAKRQKTAKHTDLEEALFLWFSDHRAKNGIVSDDILRTKAKKNLVLSWISLISVIQMAGFIDLNRGMAFPVIHYVVRVLA